MTNKKKAHEKAIFAGGCFWCTQAAFDGVEGVVGTTSGYTGGHTEHPTYEQVISGATGHYEALEVCYDPGRVTYEGLLDVFWQSIDPSDTGGQFADRGLQYHTAIFYLNKEQRIGAERSKEQIREKLGAHIATKILPAHAFYPAEGYHQDYHKINPVRYEMYKFGSGRVKKLKDLWKKDE